MPRPRKTAPPAPPERPRALLYARVSTIEQREEGYSVEAQVRALREYAERKGLDVVGLYTEAETAKRAGRAEFGRMLKDARKLGVRAIVVEKTDRLYRNLSDRVKVAELEIDVHLVKEGEVIGPGSTSSAKFVHDIKLVVAKNYVDNLSDETRKGMREKARQGYWPSHAPIGYLNVGEGSRRTIAPDPDLAPIVRAAFERYGRGDVSLTEIARFMSAAGIAHRPKGITRAGLHRLIQNPIYKGVVLWAGEEYPGRHEPIVDAAAWERCQLALAGRNPNEAGSVSVTRGEYVYRGFVRCARCGCMVCPHTAKGRYVYYACSGAKGCRRVGVTEEAITEAIAAKLDGLTIDPEILAALVEGLRQGHAERSAEANALRDRLESRVKGLRDRLERMYLDLLSNRVPATVYGPLRERTERELQDAEREFQAAERAERRSWEQDAALLSAASESAKRFREGDDRQRRDMAIGALSNLLLDGKTVIVELAPWFGMMAETNEKGKGVGASPSQMKLWLPTVDSNHD